MSVKNRKKLATWLDLLIGWPLVLGAIVVGCLYTQNDPESWAQVVILGVTALVVVYYAYQARRTADEARRTADETQRLATGTRDLATSTQRMASATWRPNVGLFVDHDDPQYSSQVFNSGPGPACELGIVASHPDSPQLLSWYVPPNQPVPPISREVEKLLEWAKASENHRYVSLCWCDIHGQVLHLKWRYIDSNWVCEGSAPGADVTKWKNQIEALKAAN